MNTLQLVMTQLLSHLSKHTHKNT